MPQAHFHILPSNFLIPLLAFHHIYQDFKNQYTWPTWNDVSDRILARLKLMRTSLDPRVLPTDIWGTLAKEYPTKA